jgi:hypothetical protein
MATGDTLNLTGYTRTFSEEFDRGTYLDTSFWETKYWWGGRSLSSNGEQQYFADRSTRIVKNYPGVDPFSLSPRAIVDRPGDSPDGVGMLTITARPSPRPAFSDNLPYISGLITSYDGDGTGFSQQYGYFEICAQVPSGQGLWPAFWLLPADGNWPPEIDVLELLGADPTTYYAGMHWDDPSTAEHDFLTTPIPAGIDLSLGFHTYGVMWSDTSLTFYLDGKEMTSMQTPDALDEAMYLLAGLAVGGTWGGAVNPSAPNPAAFPEEFKIDYIKVWQDDDLLQLPIGPQPTVSGTAGANTLFNSTRLENGIRLAVNDIFAGNGSTDTFDFTQAPVGHDVILDFSPVAGAEHDVVRISKAVSGARGFSDLYRMISNDTDGDAVLTLKDGSTLTFEGIGKAELSYDDFILVA